MSPNGNVRIRDRILSYICDSVSRCVCGRTSLLTVHHKCSPPYIHLHMGHMYTYIRGPLQSYDFHFHLLVIVLLVLRATFLSLNVGANARPIACDVASAKYRGDEREKSPVALAGASSSNLYRSYLIEYHFLVPHLCISR